MHIILDERTAWCLLAMFLASFLWAKVYYGLCSHAAKGGFWRAHSWLFGMGVIALMCVTAYGLAGEGAFVFVLIVAGVCGLPGLVYAIRCSERAYVLQEERSIGQEAEGSVQEADS